MADSWTAIGNSALIKIGASTISNIESDNSKGAQLLQQRYEACRDIVLRSHLWNCAIKRVVLSPLADPVPAYTYSVYFQLPSDLLRPIEVFPEDCSYRIEGRYIATDESEIDLKYIYRVTDPTLLDALCAECISSYIAWDISLAMTQNVSLKEALWKDFTTIMRQAKSTDAKEDPGDYLRADLWIDSRQGPSDGGRLDNYNS